MRPRGLPQGFRNSCAVWTKLVRVLTAKWRREGKRLVHLLDDLLFSVTGTFEEACAVRDEIVADLDAVGIQVNWLKSVQTPGHIIKFLGMIIDSIKYRFFVPGDKVRKLQALVGELVQRGGADSESEVAFRELAKVLGKMISMQIAVPMVRMLASEGYGLLRPGGDWDAVTVLSVEALRGLERAAECVAVFNDFGNPIRKYVGMAEIRLLVDAGTGIGWRLEGKTRSLQLTPDMRAAAREWANGERGEYQCWNELLALEACVTEEADLLQGTLV